MYTILIGYAKMWVSLFFALIRNFLSLPAKKGRSTKKMNFNWSHRLILVTILHFMRLFI